jgi:uncharacterized protein YhbP (UPF0306 family)
LTADVRLFLERHTTLSLSTCDGDRPWAVNLFYASDEACRIYYASRPDTRHCRDIAANPRVSASISAQVGDWREIRGLQLDGTARSVPAADWDRAADVYFGKFPDVRRLGWVAELLRPLGALGFYEITPSWIRLIDNGQGFGHKDEFTF